MDPYVDDIPRYLACLIVSSMSTLRMELTVEEREVLEKSALGYFIDHQGNPPAIYLQASAAATILEKAHGSYHNYLSYLGSSKY